MTQTIDRASVAGRSGMFRRWPDWAPYAAAVWAVGYALAALGWTFTGTPAPIKNHDDGDALSLLSALPDNAAAPVLATVAVAAGAVGFAMTQADGRIHRWWRRSGLAFGAALTAALLFIVPDMRLLAIVGYLPMMIFVVPFDADLRADVADALTIVYLNQFAAVIGGLLWAGATLVFARRTAGACPQCGRGVHQRAWTTPEAAARWGRTAVFVGVAVPVIYALTRWIWVLGIPLGINREFHAEGTADGSLWSGAWLGTFALVGAVLMLGLVQRWGEVFPRWLPGLRGRRVPIGLAVVPASLVSVLLISGGTSLIGGSLTESTFGWDDWAAAGPAFLVPVWGIALGVATLAYYLRRRGVCARCFGGDLRVGAIDIAHARTVRTKAPGKVGPSAQPAGPSTASIPPPSGTR